MGLICTGCLSHTVMDSVCVCSWCFCSSGPVAALAGVPVDEARLAVVNVGVSLEALEVGGFISWILIQAIKAALTKGGYGVLGGGRCWGGGGLRGEACRISINVTIRHKLNWPDSMWSPKSLTNIYYFRVNIFTSQRTNRLWIILTDGICWVVQCIKYWKMMFNITGFWNHYIYIYIYL